MFIQDGRHAVHQLARIHGAKIPRARRTSNPPASEAGRFLLHSLEDGTASAYLTHYAPGDRAAEAVAFVMGTAADRFHRIEALARTTLPPPKGAPAYLLEVDGGLALVRHMVVTVHANRSGVLLVLLPALAARKVNVLDLPLAERGDKGYAAIGVQGDEREVASLLAAQLLAARIAPRQWFVPPCRA